MTLIELSKAIKCPDIATFLSGMKKIQEFLIDENVLRQLCDNDLQLVESLKDVFADFLSLNDLVI